MRVIKTFHAGSLKTRLPKQRLRKENKMKKVIEVCLASGFQHQLRTQLEADKEYLRRGLRPATKLHSSASTLSASRLRRRDSGDVLILTK